ncbi:hypothetical protein H4R34_001514 [Dimargaris verticillata]|uniref:Chromatin modification-related protein EAF7-domain-containing protein n=1 Tax=Dimargaris verticillata TaxID=2761393 RepID=A0A9W8B9R9_9FUNG|nr:hypothetical protein H4R34_001514 [Dimargaris verticillata]
MEDDSHSFDSALTDSMHWTPQREIALYQAMVGKRPVGLHKHFRMVAIYHQFLNSGVEPCTTQDIWEKLSELFDLQILDDIDMGSTDDSDDANESSEKEVDGGSETKRTDSTAKPLRTPSRSKIMPIHHPNFWKYPREFELPWEDYESLIAEHGKDPNEPASDDVPMSIPISTTSSTRSLRARKPSPSVSASSSRAATPESEREAPVLKKTRRSTSNTRKESLALQAESRPSTPMSRRKTSRHALPLVPNKPSSSVATRRSSRKT